MTTINMLEAKTTLSRLVDAIEQGRETEIVIARNGKPAAKLVPLGTTPSEHRVGIAKGLFVVPDDIDQNNEEVVRLFLGQDH